MDRLRRAICLVAGILLGLASRAHAQTVTEFYNNISIGAAPIGITAGPCFNGGPVACLWFTESQFTNRIGRIDTNGNVQEFSAGITANAALGYITAGPCLPGGPVACLWFTEDNGNQIGQITPDGVVTEVSAGLTAGARPSGITAGPCFSGGPIACLWFTEFGAFRIGRIDPGTGHVDEFSAGITTGPGSITAGPDGNLWFTESGGGFDHIGRITPSGTVSEFSTGITAGANPHDITAGPCFSGGPIACLWFTEGGFGGFDKIGQITLSGVITEFSAGITAGARPSGITLGPDGNLWFTEVLIDRIGWITPDGVVTEVSAGISPGAAPYGITAGPDGNLWFTEAGLSRIGRITTGSGSPAHITSASARTFVVGGPGVFQVTTTGDLPLSLTETGGLPDGVHFADNHDGTATLNGTPGPNAAGVYPLLLTASNGLGSPDTQNFVLTVEIPPATSFTDPDPTPDGGSASAFLSGGGASCVFSRAAFINVSGDPRSPQAAPPFGVAFPKGLFDFAARGCDPGSTLTIEISYSIPLPPPGQYYKYGPRPGPIAPAWYPFPSHFAFFAIDFTITDGDIGDDDLQLNGIIVDAGGPGIPPATAPAFTNGPPPASATVGTAYAFSYTASGTAPIGFSVSSGALPPGLSLSSAGDISGTPTTAGTFTGAVTASNGTPPDATQGFSIAVTAASVAPAITIQPVGQTVCASQSASFTAAASGTPTPAVRWQVSVDGGSTFNDIPGATSATLSFATASADNNKRYRAVFTNIAGSATSNAAALTVNTSPAVTAQPSNQTVNVGQSVTFTAASSGSPTPAVQWQVSTTGGSSFSDISGANSPTLSFTASGSQNGNLYRAVFANSCGSATTNAATLTVTTGCAAITINPPTLHAATAGKMYTQELSVSGEGTAWHVTFSLGAGAPAWLSLKGHVLHGIPPAPGQVTFTVNATNAKGCTAARTYTLEVRCPEIVVIPAALPVGIRGKAYSHGIKAAGSLEGATFAVTDGALPPGLQLSATTLWVPEPGEGAASGATLYGVPTELGSFTFTITATDSRGCAGSHRYTLVISSPGSNGGIAHSK